METHLLPPPPRKSTHIELNVAEADPTIVISAVRDGGTTKKAHVLVIFHRTSTTHKYFKTKLVIVQITARIRYLVLQDNVIILVEFQDHSAQTNIAVS